MSPQRVESAGERAGHPTSLPAARLVAAFLVVAALIALLDCVRMRHATSWHFFSDAAHALLRPHADRGGLDVYTTHPEFQFGPLAVLLAAPFAFLAPGIGTGAVMVAGSALGIVAVVAVADAARALHPTGDAAEVRRAVLAGGSVLLIVWGDIAIRTAHLDDAVALAATAVAVDAVSRRHPWLAVAAISVAAAAKPWALVAAPLALVGPGTARVVRPALVGAIVAATWLPFVLDDPGTIGATGSFAIRNAPSSALRALHVTAAGTPHWDRPVQIGLGLAVATWLAVRRRWPGIVMAGLAIRLMLDPGVHHYYSAGLTLGVLAWELLVRPGRLPWLTVLTAIVLEVTPSGLHPAALAGAIRLALTASLVLLACAGPRRPPTPAPTPTPGGRCRTGGLDGVAPARSARRG